MMERRRALMGEHGSGPDPLMLNDILTLDGIQNTRSGHNADSTTWEDLSGNSRDFAKKSGSSNAVWDTDCLICNGTKRVLTMTSDILTGRTAMSFEFVIKITGRGSMNVGNNYYGVVFMNDSWNSSKSMRFIAYNTDAFIGRCNGTSSGGMQNIANELVYGVWVYDGTDCRRYLNGELVDTVANTFPPASKPTTYYIGGSSTDGAFPKADLHRVGISAHAMSASEIAERFAFFADRFGITA